MVRRYERTTSVVALVIMMAATCQGAGWLDVGDGAIWPSMNTSPRKKVGAAYAKDLWSWQCYSSIYEKATSLDLSEPTAPAWYRFERQNLTAYKLWVKNNGDEYQDQDSLDDELTIPNLLSQVGAPSNYLDRTPWFDLNGMYSTGTPSWCASNYNVSDYGWKYMPAILSTMRVTRVDGWNLSTSSGAAGKTANWDSGGCSQPTWAGAKAEAVANGVPAIYSFGGYAQGHHCGSLYGAQFSYRLARIPLTNSSEVAIDIDIYFDALAVGDWDDNGTGYQIGYGLQDSFHCPALSTIEMTVGLNSQPSWPDEPHYGIATITRTGFQIVNPPVQIRSYDYEYQ